MPNHEPGFPGTWIYRFGLLLFQLFLTLASTYISLWLFFNIKFENKGKKWFTLIFNGIEWNPVLKSMDLLNQIKSYSREK